MIVAQVFLEAMEGCHLFLSPLFVMQTEIFRVSPSAVVQVFVGLQRWRPDDFVGCYRSPFGTGLVGWVPLPPAGFCSGASMLLVLVGLSTGAPFPGWFHELVWQLPVLARLSSALLFPWNFRCTVWQLLVCVELQGALPSARWFRWTVWRLPICVELRGALPSARWFRWTAALFGHFSCFWKGPPVLPFPTFFHQRLFLLFLSSFCLNFIKVTKFPATFARRSHKNRAKTATDKQTCTSNARPCAPHCSSPVPPDIATDKQTCTSKARPCAPNCSSPVPLDIATDKQTFTSKARPCAPHWSSPVPPGYRHRQTNLYLESSALRASQETRVPNISPLTRGNYHVAFCLYNSQCTWNASAEFTRWFNTSRPSHTFLCWAKTSQLTNWETNASVSRNGRSKIAKHSRLFAWSYVTAKWCLFSVEAMK